MIFIVHELNVVMWMLLHLKPRISQSLTGSLLSERINHKHVSSNTLLSHPCCLSPHPEGTGQNDSTCYFKIRTCKEETVKANSLKCFIHKLCVSLYYTNRVSLQSPPKHWCNTYCCDGCHSPCIREAFLIITSFFLQDVSTTLELCLSKAGEKKTWAKCQIKRLHLHLPLGVKPPELA